MKITISGLAGAGSSTLALILSKSLGFKLFQGGEVFRYVYKNLKFNTKGSERNEASNLVEPYFGPIYDAYIDSILLDNLIKNIVIESDITAFRVGRRSDLLSVFLKARSSVRASRTEIDGRKEDGDIIQAIDNVHRESYLKLHNIDIFDEDLIKKSHYLVIDNSDISLSDEIMEVYSHLKNFDVTFNAIDISSSKMLEIDYFSKGKEVYKSILKDLGLVVSHEYILDEICNKFKKEVDSLPFEIKKIVKNL